MERPVGRQRSQVTRRAPENTSVAVDVGAVLDQGTIVERPAERAHLWPLAALVAVSAAVMSHR
jgi:hypothetical protein